MGLGRGPGRGGEPGPGRPPGHGQGHRAPGAAGLGRRRPGRHLGGPRPVPLSALEAQDTTFANQGAQNILITGPFAAVRIFDAAGTLAASATLPGVTPTPLAATDGRATTFGAPISVGSRIARQVAVSLGGSRARLVVDVDLTRLLGRPADLRFGRTGEKFLTTADGTIVAGSSAVGSRLRSPINLDIAAAGKPVTTVIYSPFFGRLTAESYEPIPGQNLGILVQQARSEVMHGADALAARLRWAAFAVAMLGAGLAVSMGLLLSRRARRLASAELRLSESHEDSRRRLEQFLEAVPIGVFVARSDGEPYYANREAERLLGRGIVPGVAPEQLAEVYDAYVAGTDDRYPAASMPLVRALQGETSHADDMEIHRPGGTIPVEVWGTAARAGDGSVEYGITAFADVSERRRAAQELEFLSAMTAGMSEGVVLVRAEDSAIAYANGSYAAMFGYEVDELIGRSMRELTAPDPAAAGDFDEIRKALRDSGTWRGEIRGLRKDGTELWCAVNVAISTTRRSGPAGSRSTPTSPPAARRRTHVTARKRAETALLEREEQLAVARDVALEASRLEERLPRQHEPRDPHAHERGHRPDRPAARHVAQRGADGVRVGGPFRGRSAAGDHQRHPRLLQDRGREAPAGGHGLRAADRPRRGGRPPRGQGPGEGAGDLRPGRPRRALVGPGRPRPGAAGADQPGRQRHQVQRPRADRRAGDHHRHDPRGDDDSASRSPTPAWGSRPRGSGSSSRHSPRSTRPPPGATAVPAWAWPSPSSWSR